MFRKSPGRLPMALFRCYHVVFYIPHYTPFRFLRWTYNSRKSNSHTTLNTCILAHCAHALNLCIMSVCINRWLSVCKTWRGPKHIEWLYMCGVVCVCVVCVCVVCVCVCVCVCVTQTSEDCMYDVLPVATSELWERSEWIRDPLVLTSIATAATPYVLVHSGARISSNFFCNRISWSICIHACKNLRSYVLIIIVSQCDARNTEVAVCLRTVL